MKNKLIIALALLACWYYFFYQPQVTLGPGSLAPDAPSQQSVQVAQTFSVNDYQVTPLASFHLKARVLGRKDYHFGREAELSPTDLAMGWGRMSDEQVLSTINIRQSNRWYHWRTDNFPIPRREIETSSANMHIIPANNAVKAQLKKVRRGDIVEIRGSLVKVLAADGWQWRSSLTREDAGSGSCELIWVEDIYIHSG